MRADAARGVLEPRCRIERHVQARSCVFLREGAAPFWRHMLEQSTSGQHLSSIPVFSRGHKICTK